MTTELAGTYVAMVTPFDATGINAPGLRANIDWWISEGVHGLIPSGSTGEFLQLSEDERAGLIEATVRFAAGRVPVVAGASADSTAEAIRWSKFAESVGASAVMVVAPYYSQPDDHELFEHYRAIAEAIGIPVMVYNNPSTTGVDIRPPLLAELSEIDNVRYVKESTTDVRRVQDILIRSDGRMHVFAGILAFESFVVGATGWVSVPANLAPRLSADLYEMAVLKRDWAAAAECNRRLWPLMALEDETGKYVQIPKEGLDLMGRASGGARAPRLPLDRQTRARLETVMQEMKLVGDGLLPT